jgi:hypothetical protein
MNTRFGLESQSRTRTNIYTQVVVSGSHNHSNRGGGGMTEEEGINDDY